MTISRAEALEVARLTYHDPILFCRTFLPHYFPRELPWYQRAILAILVGRCDFLASYGELEKIVENFVIVKQEIDPKTNQIVDIVSGGLFSFGQDGQLEMHLSEHDEIIMPRGAGKTTIAGVAVPLRKAVYKDVNFLLYTSHAEDHAIMQLENVKREIEGNAKLIEVFGELKPARTDSERWSARLFETTNGFIGAARGVGGQVRGLIHNGHRPDQIIADDLEDSESVKSDSTREKIRTWFMQDLKQVLPKIGNTGRMTVLGTVLHEDCLVERLASDPDWSTVRLAAVDRRGQPIWRDYMDEKRLAKEKASFARMGNIRGFYMEYMSKTIAGETLIFKPEYFRYGMPPGELTAIAIAMDPALSEKRTADETCISVVGMTDRGYFVLLDEWAKRGQDDKMKLDAYFGLVRKWGMLERYAGRFGIESQAYQATLLNTCREMMFRKGMYFEITPITHKQKKTWRIKGTLQPRFAAGVIHFARRFPITEMQLIDFREDDSHLHDDRIDALAMATALLDDFAPQAADKDLDKDEYPPLEEVIGGDGQWVH